MVVAIMVGVIMVVVIVVVAMMVVVLLVVAMMVVVLLVVAMKDVAVMVVAVMVVNTSIIVMAVMISIKERFHLQTITLTKFGQNMNYSSAVRNTEIFSVVSMHTSAHFKKKSYF